MPSCRAGRARAALVAGTLAAVDLYPGGYSLASAWDWNNGTGPNIPVTPGGTVTPATFITAWLQYFAFEKNIGTTGVADEPFTKACFEKLEKLAPFWDDTDPDLGPFEKAGGKLILWQGGGDWSIPTISSTAYYQAVVTAMGGVAAAQKFTRYYVLPSVGHCGGGAPDTYPGLADVVRWTEKGKAPNGIQANEYQSSLPSAGPGGPPRRRRSADDRPHRRHPHARRAGRRPRAAVDRVVPLSGGAGLHGPRQRRSGVELRREGEQGVPGAHTVARQVRQHHDLV